MPTMSAILLAWMLSSVASTDLKSPLPVLGVSGRNFRLMERHIPRDSFSKQGRSDGSEIHEVVFAIHQHNLDTLDQILIDVSSPNSPTYQQWLTYSEVGNLIANPHSAQAVVDYLLNSDNVEDPHWTDTVSAGSGAGANSVPVEVVWQSRRQEYIRVRARISFWERLFDTTFYVWEDLSKHRYVTDKDEDGERKRSLMHRAEQYSLPEELIPHVTAVFNTVQVPPVFKPKYHRKNGRDGSSVPVFRRNLRISTISTPTLPSAQRDTDKGVNSLDENGAVTVSFLNSFYKINSNVGDGNLTQSVFETADEYFSPNDLQSFQEYYGLTEQAAQAPYGFSTSNCVTNDCYEGNLDVQYIMGVAQVTQAIYWYTSDSGAEDPFVAWITDVADDPDPPQANSISWGAIEQTYSASVMDSFNTEAQKVAAMGVTVTVSSGDDGVASESTLCNVNSGSAIASGWGGDSWSGRGYFPSFPATSPYVTAVGGTMGPQDGNEEVACQSDKGGVITSGGGFSTHFEAPDWQTQAVADYFDSVAGTSKEPTSGYNPNGRAYPDVSLIAVEYQVVVQGFLESLYGTSCSAPVFAAFVSLVNASRRKKGLATIGFLNPTLYSYGYNTSQSVFNDVTSGDNHCVSYSGANPDNAVCCDSGFYCKKGWDPVTGWGSIDYTEFSAMFSVATPYSGSSSGSSGNDDDGSSQGLSEGELIAVVVLCVLAAVGVTGVAVYCFLLLPKTASTCESVQSNQSTVQCCTTNPVLAAHGVHGVKSVPEGTSGPSDMDL